MDSPLPAPPSRHSTNNESNGCEALHGQSGQPFVFSDANRTFHVSHRWSRNLLDLERKNAGFGKQNNTF
jgi:hypothetical protein